MGVSTVRNFGTVIDQDLASINIMFSEYPFPVLTGLEGELKYDPSDKGKLPKRAIRSFLDTVTSNAQSWKVEANLTGFSDNLPVTYPALAHHLNGGDTSQERPERVLQNRSQIKNGDENTFALSRHLLGPAIS
jgi:hypothetical protein